MYDYHGRDIIHKAGDNRKSKKATYQRCLQTLWRSINFIFKCLLAFCVIGSFLIDCLVFKLVAPVNWQEMIKTNLTFDPFNMTTLKNP